MLNRLNEALDDIKEIKSAVNNITVEITRQHYDMYGNGKKGIIERVEDLEKENKNINGKLAYFAGVIAVVGAIIGYIVGWFK